MRRILAIDGGGIKGIFPISFLAHVEETIGDNISHYFDLIAGTSTGGIIALGLGIGFSAREILCFYEELGRTVFKGNRILRAIRGLGFSKYTQEPLREALEAKFGQRTLGQSTKRLIIPSLNLETGEVYVYKTSHHPRFETDHRERVVDVALATAAAPTYFPTFRSSAGVPLLDGGMWANNPAGMAAVEAIGVLGWPRDSLRVLSLGCTTEPLGVGLGRKLGLGIWYWAWKAIDVFIAAQSSSSLGTTQILAGHDNVVRISPLIQKRKFGLDAITEMDSLRGLGASEARKALPRLQEMFFTERVEPFVQMI